jgi:hypothetical protein
MKPLLFLRVGYMQRYDGPAAITSGGAYIHERGVGGEIYNFKPSRGRCFGYAMTLHSSGIRLDMLDPGPKWQVGDTREGVDVVFFARRPGYGQVIVGWYRDATVFHRQYLVRRGHIPGMDEVGRHYVCMVDAPGATLLPEPARTFEVPSAPSGAKGFPGQANVWYPGHHLDRPEVRRFVASVRRYLGSRRGQPLPTDERPPARGGKRSRQTDAAHNAAVERSAVNRAWKHWERKGFSVRSVETDNIGWDLVARRGRTEWRIEVKGTSDDTMNFQLTPNEYNMLRQHHAVYRVCVVLDALECPKLYEFGPKKQRGGWMLTSTDGQSIKVRLEERTAAVGVEMPT